MLTTEDIAMQFTLDTQTRLLVALQSLITTGQELSRLSAELQQGLALAHRQLIELLEVISNAPNSNSR